MKRIIMTTIAAATLVGCADQPPQLNPNNIDQVIKAMTLEEKVQLVYGTGMEGATGTECVVGSNEKIIPGAAGTTHAIPRLGIPEIVLADGPAGLRIKPIRSNTDKTFYCTAFPIATVLSSTWNTELVENVGKAIGNETLEYGVDIILSPGVNIHRNPLCGRNYEYYSEDPILAGKTAAALIRGIQSYNVGTSIKHFAGNNQETARTKTDSRIPLRALREIYLKQFEIAIKESTPWTVMTSYNYLNGVYASENKQLLEDVLRNEWGYNNMVMTDWFGGSDAAAQMLAGNDLLMPGVEKQYDEIINAVKKGILSQEVLDKNVKRILQLIVKTPRFNKYNFSNNPDLKAHAQITRQSACEGTILLENKNNTLPLKNIKNAAVFGITSYNYISGGTGSGDVNEEYTISLTEGLENAGINVDKDLQTIYKEQLEKQHNLYKSDTTKRDSMVYRFVPQDNIDFGSKLSTIANKNDVALITFGRVSGEFKDRKLEDFYLSENEKKLLNDVAKAFKAQKKKTIVILNIGGVIETNSWRNIPDAIVLPWMGGQEGGNAVADILMGKENPSGKLPMTFPLDYWDVPSAKNFPYDVEPTPYTLFGSPEDNHVNKENIDYTEYNEGIFVGYRHYTTKNIKTAYPFGFGLSYTTFSFSNDKIENNNNKITISVEIKNTGKVAGKEVAQVYVQKPQSTNNSQNPKYELLAFAKTKLLQPNESQVLTMEIDPYSLASYYENDAAWKTEVGNYTIFIGNNVENLPIKNVISIDKELIVKTNDVLHQK